MAGQDSNELKEPFEPFNLEEPYKSWALNAQSDRLQYLRQMYSCMFVASQGGESCYDPIFMHYPFINASYENPEHTFIVANAFKVSPVLEPNVTTYQSFFPNGEWINLNNFSDILFVNGTDGSDIVNLTAP